MIRAGGFLLVALVALVVLALVGLRVLRWWIDRQPHRVSDAEAQAFRRWKRAEFGRFVKMVKQPPRPVRTRSRSAFKQKWRPIE